jgi:hypothetical protein
VDDFESRKITNSRKFWSKKLFTLKLGGACVDTIFFGKIGQKDKEKELMECRVQSAD